jgi:hypothetical protein
MFGYKPTPEGFAAAVDEYFRVRDQLREIFEDYVLLYSMRGVQYHIDVFLDDAERERRAQEALEDAKYLDGLLERMHTLATTDPRALRDEWPGILNVLERYTYHHQFLKGVRPLAKLWQLDIDEAVARARPGRPRGPTMNEGQFRHEYPETYLYLLRRDRDRPSQLKVAAALGLSERTFRNYLRDYDLPWPPA